MSATVLDGFALERNTAAKLSTLCKLRGVRGNVTWNESLREYVANGESCGPSVHDVLEWLNRQPGVRP